MVPKQGVRRLSEITFDPVIYPRRNHDPMLVQKYAECLDEIEAKGNFISIAEDGKLLDGKHRWLAYKKAFDDDREVQVYIYQVTAPHEQLLLATELNSDFGWQLSDEDKEDSAKTLFSYGYNYDDIAKALSVSKAKVSSWLSRIVKDNKEKRDRRIFDMWLSCHTQEEIAEAVDLSQQAIAKLCDDFTTTVLQNQSSKTLALYSEPDWKPPIYNVWKQQEKTTGVKHFGNSEVRWLDNLLYLYTEPFDVVIDPFAGGGSTIDVCKRRMRRHYVSDRKPIVEREIEIRKHDMIGDAGKIQTPSVPRWKDVSLVYLDPPYWKQAEGKYSDDPTDLANITLEEFTGALAGIVKAFGSKLKASQRDKPSFIALIIQPTQWKADDRGFADHVGDMLRLVNLPVDMRYSVPYESQQCTAQMVTWANENKRCLVLTREIIVWRVG